MGQRGRFYVLEGGEGVGKSTQAARLARQLDAVLTREPGGTPLGEALRDLLLDPGLAPVEPRAELLMMVAARAQHVTQVIEPALAAGRDVVCDRFSGSTLAYQGYGRGIPLDEVRRACDLATRGLVPDATVLLELDLARAARRRPAGHRDRIEAEDRAFHERVRAGFGELARQPGWVVVDAAQPEPEVAAAVLAGVAGLDAAGGGRR